MPPIITDASGRPVEKIMAPVHVNFTYDILGNATDAYGWIADGNYELVSCIFRPRVAGTDGGAVTATIKKAPSATAIASGTDMLAASANLKGAADTNQSIALSATAAARRVAAGDAVGPDFTGTLTSATGTITLVFVPLAS